MVQKLVENNRLKLFPAEFNMYDLISNASLVIGFPITSPLQIAKELGIKCTYYSSSSLLLNSEELNGIKFIQTQNELENFIFSVMKSKELYKH
jgi:polysaccharide biosynthesis PFTS motif protein